MAWPMMENPIGEFCFWDNEKVALDSTKGKEALHPTEDIVYYESIRVKEQVLIFFENHMVRLAGSIAQKENFPLDIENIFKKSRELLEITEDIQADCNLRIVISKNHQLIHLIAASSLPKEAYQRGIATTILPWERVEPQVKIFRDDYKVAVKQAFTHPSLGNKVEEVLLVSKEGSITEGSRSNFFVLLGNTVYSPPSALILEGITRRYVISAIAQAGFTYEEKLFSLESLVNLQAMAGKEKQDFSLFLTSSPFDILPISSIGEISFPNSVNPAWLKIAQAYEDILAYYIASRKDFLKPKEDEV